MLDIKSLLPTQKEKRLRKESKAPSPILPLKFKFLLEPARGKEPEIYRKAREKFLQGKALLPYAGEIPLPRHQCLKKGGCLEGREDELLSGFSWLIPPAFSYPFSKDEGILKGVLSSLSSWIDKNPPLRGKGWEVEESVMTRAMVFPLIYDSLKPGLKSEKKFVRKLATSILQHYIYIREELKPKDWRRILRLPALIFAGIFLRKFSMPAVDFDLYLEEFLSFLHDEMDKEGIFRGKSVEEHLLFFEASLYTTLLLSRNKYLTGEAWERLERAGRFLLELKSLDRLLPIGGLKGIYLFPLHLLTRNPEFLVSLLCSAHKSSRVGTAPVDGVEVFAKPEKGDYKPTGLCSKESGVGILRNGNLSIVLTSMISQNHLSLSLSALKDLRELITPDSGLAFHAPEPFSITKCGREMLEGIIGSKEEATALIKVIKKGKAFSLEVDVKKSTEAILNLVLYPETRLSFQENIMELSRENSSLKVKLPSGKKTEVEFTRTRSGKISPNITVEIKKPGKFLMEFS